LKKIKVAFIGSGYMAEEYARVINKKFKNDIIIVGATNKSHKRINNFVNKYNIKNHYTQISKMMNDTNPDLVIICVNELSTFKVLKIVSKYPCVSLIEKPVGINFEENQKIIKLKKNKAFHSFVALNRRFYSSIINSVKILKKDHSKRIINIFDQENIILAKLAGQPVKVLKNWMYANSIHMIDLIYYFGRGKIVKITKISKDNYLKEGTVSCKITFSSGDIVNYFSLWNRPAPWSVEISTKNYFINLKPVEKVSYLKGKIRKWIQLDVSKNDTEFKPGIYLQLVEALKFIKKKKTKLKDLKYSNKLMKLIKDIYFD